MKLARPVKINDKLYSAGEEIAWYKIYPFFIVHMFMFGASGFLMAYVENHPPFIFMVAHGGIAITAYVFFYISFFGIDEVKWMFINAGLGIFALYTQVNWILSLFGKNIKDYPFHLHIIPFIYYTLYIFLIRQAFIDIFRVRENTNKKQKAGYFHIAISIILSILSWLA